RSRLVSSNLPPWCRRFLNGLDMTDETVDEFPGVPLGLDIGPLLDPELVSPDRHRARPMSDDERPAVDDGPDVRGRESAVVALREPRQIRHRDIQRRRHRAVAPAGGAVTSGAETVEQLGARVIG